MIELGFGRAIMDPPMPAFRSANGFRGYRWRWSQLHNVERLDAIAAMFDCDESVAAHINHDAAVQDFRHKAPIGHQGDQCDFCWLVLEGIVNVQLLGLDGQHVQIAYHGPGEIFGAYPEPATNRADLVANGDVRLLRIGTQSLARMASQNAAIGAGLARLLGRQLDTALDRIATRSTLSAAGRVYSELVRICDGKQRVSPAPKMTMLALRANTTRETTSRAIASLERRGVISRDDAGLTVIAPRMLQDMIA